MFHALKSLHSLSGIQQFQMFEARVTYVFILILVPIKSQESTCGRLSKKKISATNKTNNIEIGPFEKKAQLPKILSF